MIGNEFRHYQVPHSKSSVRRAIYEAIAGVARPSDVCFFITEDPDHYRRLSRWQRMYRRWMGFARGDPSIWHLGILSKFEKKPRSSQVRPYFIHSVEERGVTEQHISPEYFTSADVTRDDACRTVMEILRYEGMTDGQSDRLLDFCRRQIGKRFPRSVRGESLTYILGMPNILNSPDEFSCHSLVYAAFDHIGVGFPHHLEAAPFFNIANTWGTPSSTAREDNPTFYGTMPLQDPRFKSLINPTWDRSPMILIRGNPEKFSWNPDLAAAYLPTSVATTGAWSLVPTSARTAQLAARSAMVLEARM
jgi:hypothetical protein